MAVHGEVHVYEVDQTTGGETHTWSGWLSDFVDANPEIQADVEKWADEAQNGYFYAGGGAAQLYIISKRRRH